MTPIEEHITADKSLTETEIQRQRYMLGGKGEDGDPAFARDMSLLRKKHRENVEESDREYRYKRDGD